jgi:hypothetical protein
VERKYLRETHLLRLLARDAFTDGGDMSPALAGAQTYRYMNQQFI